MEGRYEDPNDDLCTTLYRLPKWMLSKCSDEEKCRFREKYFLMQTASTGECLFHSIHLCLLTTSGHNAYTTYELRHAVASTILDKRDKYALGAMESWKTLLTHAFRESDEDMIREWKHAAPLLADESPFSHQIRKQIFDNMLNPNTYWGDEYAIQVLEQILRVKFLILKKTKLGKQYVIQGQLGTQSGREHFEPSWYGILLLDDQHYMPLVKRMSKKNSVSETQKRGEEFIACFQEKHVPEFVLNAFSSTNKEST